jgi:PAS domain S-box-containing protein
VSADASFDFGETIARAATRAAEPRERTGAVACTLVLCALAFLWATGHRLSALTSGQFVAFYATTLALCAIFTAILLIWRARLIGDAGSARVAAAFLYCVPLVAAYAMTYPGVIPAFGSQREASGWVWFGWRIGWAALLTWYAVGKPRRVGNLRRSLAIGMAAAAAVLIVSFSGALPDWYEIGTNAFLPAAYAGYALTTVATLAALIALVRMRPMTALNAWLIVPLGTGLAAGILGMFDRVRFAGTSDSTRLLAVVSAVIFAWILVAELARLIERATSLDRFMTMAQYASNIVYLLDASGTVIYMNQRWTEITGQPADEALGTGWHAVAHPDDVAAGFPDRTAGIASGKRYEHQVRYRSVDGTYRWYLAGGTPTFDADGRLNGWYGISTDIDVQRRAHDQLTELYHRERQIARTLQTVFIPQVLPQMPGVQFQGVYRPALRETELGGDWYDAFLLPDGRIALSIGDVTGHGIDAAIAMVRLREALRAVTSLVAPDPAIILETADRAILGTHPDVIATAVFAVYDPSTPRLVFASAGHPPPALSRRGSATLLHCEAGLPLGVQSDSSFATEEVVLEPGDVLVFYTDGLIEGNRDLFAGERRFTEVLAEHPGDADRIVSETLDGVQNDDVALLMLSIVDVVARPSWHFQSDDAINASDARFAFVAHLERRSVDPELIARAELVFGELVANVVRHAPGPIEIELTWQGGRPLLAVRDRGPRFEMQDPKLPENALAEGGRGLFLIANLASLPAVTARPGGGNEVVVALATADQPVGVA